MAEHSPLCAAGPLVVLPRTTTVLCAQNAGQILAGLAWLIFPVTIGLAITRQSLWIDEGFTVWFASHGSFHSFYAAMIGSRGTPGDPQFIFYLLHMWGWIKVFGSSELSLRAANIPFAVIFIYTMSWASRRLFWSRNLWIMFCVSPFFWFYLNEARPYVALLAFSTVASVALLAYLIDPRHYHKSAPWFCLIAFFLAWGTHILAVFLLPALLVLIVASLAGDADRQSEFFRHWLRPALYCLPAFLVLGAFYTWVSSYGVNKVEANPGLANLAFAVYEFTGFAGIGPPRNDIRQSLSVAVFLPYWPLLLAGTAALLAVITSVFRNAPARIVRNLLLSVVCGLAIALTLSVSQHFQILGRHLAVFFPLILMTVMVAPKNPSGSPVVSRGTAISFIALALVWGVSDLRLVFLSKYEKDSYREACSIALAKARQDSAVILWAADPLTARYYGLTVVPASSPDARADQGIRPSVDNGAIDASSWSLDQTNAYFAASSAPTILVLSKPNTFDRNGAWRSLILEQEPEEIARLKAVSIFEWHTPRDVVCTSCPRQLPPPGDLLVATTPAEALLPPSVPFVAGRSRMLDTR